MLVGLLSKRARNHVRFIKVLISQLVILVTHTFIARKRKLDESIQRKRNNHITSVIFTIKVLATLFVSKVLINILGCIGYDFNGASRGR